MSRRWFLLLSSLSFALLITTAASADEEQTSGPYVRLPEDGDAGVITETTPVQEKNCVFHDVNGKPFELPALCIIRPTDDDSDKLARECGISWGYDEIEQLDSYGYWYDDANGNCETNKKINVLFRAEKGQSNLAGYDDTRYVDGSYAAASSQIICGCMREYHIGCFPYGVKIGLADGSSKEVENIAAGDLLANPVTGKPSRVKKIIESPEDQPLVHFGYDDTTVTTTQTHPVFTRDGLKKASDLSLNDFIRGADGQLHKLTVLDQVPINEGQTVVNFILETASADEESHLILSDGIVTGDMELQAKLAQPKTAMK